jgi:AcrR family transcriptional regulator
LTRRERRKLEVRTRILDAARDLFGERSFSTTRVTEICERADVAEKTFFNHFPSKQDLLSELASEGLDVLLTWIEAARKRGDTTAARIELFFDAVADSMADGGPPQRELVTELVHVVYASADPSDPARRLHDAVGALVADGLEGGDVTRRHDPETLTEMMLGAYYVLAFNFVHLESFPVRKQASAVSRFLADAFAPREDEAFRVFENPNEEESVHGPS